MRTGLVVALLGGLMLAMDSGAQGAHPLTMSDMFALKRLSDPQISPDGKHVAYVVTAVDKEKNTSTSTIWLAPTEGGAARQLTGGPKHDRHPRFSPDGGKLLFESNRSGENQLWLLSLSGGEATQLTTIASEASTGPPRSCTRIRVSSPSRFASGALKDTGRPFQVPSRTSSRTTLR